MSRSRKVTRLALFFLIIVAFIVFLPNSSDSPKRPTRSRAQPEFVDFRRKEEEHPIVYRDRAINQQPILLPKQIAKAPTPHPVLQNHQYRSNGLLEVDENGPHPIYELISTAEKRWKEKLDRASTTLEAAVAEYRRRYNRAPPKGFDLWWQYVVENNVQLPDEYDRIYHDLEPFWGIEPSDLLKTQEELEKKQDSYTLGKNETGDIDVITYAFREGAYNQLIVGSKNMINLLQPVKDYLPDFRATLSPHDGPNRLSDYSLKAAALKAAERKTYLKRDMLPKVSGTGWRFACPPDSVARMDPADLNDPPPLPSKKTFIHDHLKTMDPCVHTDHFHRHGQFLSQKMGPKPQDSLFPEFSQCSTTLHHNIRIPTPYGWVEDVSDDPPFHEKIDDRLNWRGRNTGIFHGSNTLWQNSHRDFLVRFANEIAGTISILPSNVSEEEPVGPPREFRKSRINPAVMDVAFAQGPIACSETTCKTLEEIYPFLPYQGGKQSGLYKYIIDVDGNGWSGRFKRLMTTNALIFKSTIYPEWYSERVQPWVHYVPVQVDLSDLHDVVVFFRGDGNGDGAHEDLAAKIALAGREWSKTFWRKEDLTAYFFRLILEYARLTSLDRDAMSFYLGDEED